MYQNCFHHVHTYNNNVCDVVLVSTYWNVLVINHYSKADYTSASREFFYMCPIPDT